MFMALPLGDARSIAYTVSMKYPQVEQIQQIVDAAQTIVVIQADNPDGDSLSSALALESILSEMGKTVHMYCAVDMPSYLHYLTGQSRVRRDLPKKFDASIIVDASTMTLLEKLQQSGEHNWLATKPCIVLDHHDTIQNEIPFATAIINDPKRAAAGELIYLVAKDLGWTCKLDALEYTMTAILGDTQGLTNSLASSETYRVMAKLVDAGVDRPKLEEMRRLYSKMPRVIYEYKAMLIERTEFFADNELAIVTVPQAEINAYSPLYNPAPLIQNDMLQTQDVRVAVVMKHYDDGRVTAAIRCNPGATIGAELAEHFGGGGHPYASGFKVQDGRPFNEIKSECISFATELLTKLKQGTSDEPIQHTF